MDWKDLQPLATIMAAAIGGIIAAVTALKLQDRKGNDDILLKAFDHNLARSLKQLEQNLIRDNSYLAEKGKNLAIKEDLEEIKKTRSDSCGFYRENRVAETTIVKATYSS